MSMMAWNSLHGSHWPQTFRIALASVYSVQGLKVCVATSSMPGAFMAMRKVANNIILHTFFCFKTKFLCITALAVLELTESCLPLPSKYWD